MAKRRFVTCQHKSCSESIRHRKSNVRFCSDRCKKQAHRTGKYKRNFMKNRVGYVYLMARSTNQLTKIGMSIDPELRREFIEKQLGEPVKVISKFPVNDMWESEIALHRYFSDLRVVGEWFDLGTADIDQCGDLLKGQGFSSI